MRNEGFDMKFRFASIDLFMARLRSENKQSGFLAPDAVCKVHHNSVLRSTASGNCFVMGSFMSSPDKLIVTLSQSVIRNLQKPFAFAKKH